MTVDDTLNCLLRRLEADPPVFHADEFHPDLLAWRQQMEAAGILQTITASPSATCLYCGEDDLRQVTFLADQRTGQKRGYISCPDCGPVEIPRERLQRWSINVPAFLQAAFSTGGVAVRLSESVAGRLWQTGRATWAGRSREVWFARAFRRAHAGDATKVLQGRPKAIVFAPTEAGAASWQAAAGNLVIALESALSLAGGSLAFDLPYVEGRIIDAGLGPEAAPQRRAKKRGDRAAKIELLKKEMIRHLQAARDYAFDTLDRTGEPQLLPRPLRKELGALVGLQSYEVTKCFQDPESRELNLYWEAALDLRQIMAWKGPIKRG